MLQSLKTRYEATIRSKIFPYIVFSVFHIFAGVNRVLASNGMPTPIEAAQFISLPQSAEISAFLENLASTSPYARTKWLGYSAGGRGIIAFFVSKDDDFFKEGVTEDGKLTVMLIGSQHGSEPSGAEALQQIARDLVQGEINYYLRRMNFIIIPNSNPDGRDLKKRVNTNGVNLSTDYVTLSQPESRAIVSVLKQFTPHVLLDIHESAILKKKSLGAQGYMTDFETQFEIANHPNIDAPLQTFSLEIFLPALLEAVNRKGLRASRYIGEITDVHQPITHGGISLRNLRNYSGFRGILSLLVENRLDPPGDYPTPRNIKVRIDRQKKSIQTFLEQVQLFHQRILILVRNTRNRSKNLKRGETMIALVSRYEAHPSQEQIVIPLRIRDTNEPVDITFRYYGHVRAEEYLTLPRAYAVTDHQKPIAELLDRHNIRYQTLTKVIHVRAIGQYIKEIRLTRDQAYMKRERVEYGMEEKHVNISLGPGDLWIELDQPYGLLVPLLFEPRSTENIFQYPPYRSWLKSDEVFFILRSTE